MKATQRITQPEPEQKKRPFGITAIIILQIASAMLSLVLLSADQDFLLHLAQLDVTGAGVEKILLLGSIVFRIMLAIGLWRMQRWAWLLTMILVGVSMASDIWQFIYGESEYLGMVLNVAMVFYLNQRDVQRAFIHQRVEAQRV